VGAPRRKIDGRDFGVHFALRVRVRMRAAGSLLSKSSLPAEATEIRPDDGGRQGRRRGRRPRSEPDKAELRKYFRAANYSFRWPRGGV